jgi:hypothetical protein
MVALEAACSRRYEQVTQNLLRAGGGYLLASFACARGEDQACDCDQHESQQNRQIYHSHILRTKYSRLYEGHESEDEHSPSTAATVLGSLIWEIIPC